MGPTFEFSAAMDLLADGGGGKDARLGPLDGERMRLDVDVEGGRRCTYVVGFDSGNMCMHDAGGLG